MAPALMNLEVDDEINRRNVEVADEEMQYQKGVKHLCDKGISRVPNKYILPIPERPNSMEEKPITSMMMKNIKLPIIDFAELQGSNRSQFLESLANACESYGFFQLVNHGLPTDVISDMIDVATRFFELPFEEREKYMSSDMFSPVRYGTSFNQNKDGVFCWRDFLKLSCHPTHDVLPHWPASPVDLRKSVAIYSEEVKNLFIILMMAILETLGLARSGTGQEEEDDNNDDDDLIKEVEDGSQLMIVNCYPPCPEPELTLGMPPHSDYGLLTLLLQDEVEGLQIQHQGDWLTVAPIPNSFVVNVGDHLEIFSNGKYKSVLHRVIVNSSKRRISVASLHSLPLTSVIRPSAELINESNPKRYKDTDFATFLDYISSCEPKRKNFLDSRKLIQ